MGDFSPKCRIFGRSFFLTRGKYFRQTNYSPSFLALLRRPHFPRIDTLTEEQTVAVSYPQLVVVVINYLCFIHLRVAAELLHKLTACIL